MKKRIRRRKKKNISAKTQLIKQIRRTHSDRNVEFIEHHTGMAKMSDMLGELIEPYADAADTEEAYYNLVALGAVAWNTAAMPPKTFDQSLAFLDQVYPEAEDKKIAQSLLMELMKRKLELFADVNRMIVDFSITPVHDGWHLEVASTLPPTGT